MMFSRCPGDAINTALVEDALTNPRNSSARPLPALTSVWSPWSTDDVPSQTSVTVLTCSMKLSVWSSMTVPLTASIRIVPKPPVLT
jgi:hypothetical protein